MSDARHDNLSRRAFGQILGVAALTGALPEVSLGAPSPHPPVDGSTDRRALAGDELCDLTAIDLAARIRRRQLSARGVMAAHLSRIERVNPGINAIVTLVADRAMADAKKADALQARGGVLGPLHWPAGGAHGSREHRRHTHDVRLATVPGQRADHGRTHRHAYSRRRRNYPR